ncbi:MAG: hypothetical protein KKG33_08815 [candidate division Zixibacteria bacterium]|nr:hypothetical protein [candidate division Zixibacteria bacterium]
MNPQLVYASYFDEALVKRITSEKYQTFVAMPFKDQGYYRSETVLKIIESAFEELNSTASDWKPDKLFDKPKPVNKIGDYAIRITDEIVERILDSNFIIADISGNNPNVLLELGIALASRRDAQSILVITQDSIDNLSFDIKDVKVLQYAEDSLKRRLQECIRQMEPYEMRLQDQLVNSIRRCLPANAIMCLGDYRALYKHENYAIASKPLYFEISSFCPPEKRENLPRLEPRYCQELWMIVLIVSSSSPVMQLPLFLHQRT